MSDPRERTTSPAGLVTRICPLCTPSQIPPRHTAARGSPATRRLGAHPPRRRVSNCRSPRAPPIGTATAPGPLPVFLERGAHVGAVDPCSDERLDREQQAGAPAPSPGGDGKE